MKLKEKNDAHAQDRENKLILIEIEKKNKQAVKKADRYPHFFINSLFDVDKYFFKFSVLTN